MSRPNLAHLSQRLVTKESSGMEEHVEAILEDFFICIYI